MTDKLDDTGRGQPVEQWAAIGSSSCFDTEDRGRQGGTFVPRRWWRNRWRSCVFEPRSRFNPADPPASGGSSSLAAVRWAAVSPQVHRASERRCLRTAAIIPAREAFGIRFPFLFLFFSFFFFFFFKDSVCGLLHGSDYSLQQRCARRIQLFIGETTAIYWTPRCVCMCQTLFFAHQS